MTDEELIAAAADRIEALLNRCDDLQFRLDAANKSRAFVMAMAIKRGNCAKAAEVKLAKAVKALQTISDTHNEQWIAGRIARAALAEIDSESQP